MKFLSLIFLILLIGCEPKEDKPELDFVNIEIFPLLGGPPSNLKIDLSKRVMIFSNLQHMGSIDENCNDYYEKIELPIEFIYIDLSKEEMKSLKSVLNKDFLNEVKKANQSAVKKEFKGIFDGILFEFDILSNDTIFSSDDLLILRADEETKIYNLLKILNKHTKSEWNKKYIDNLSFYLTNFPDQSNYKQKFP